MAGVVSFGNGCALPNYPGVYVEVRAFVNWIEAHESGAAAFRGIEVNIVAFMATAVALGRTVMSL